MSWHSSEQVVLLILQNSILAALVVRLWVTKLVRKYPYFFGYLLMACLQALALSFLPADSPGYIYPWLITPALLTCFCALILLPFHSLLLPSLPPIPTPS